MRTRTHLPATVILALALLAPVACTAASEDAGRIERHGYEPPAEHEPEPNARWARAAHLAPSAWMTARAERAATLLAEGEFDLLVLPVQTQALAFSRATRTWLGLALTRAIARASGLRVADPNLVATALGDGARRIPASRIEALAKRLGVPSIVQVHAGHTGARRMLLALARFDLEPERPLVGATPSHQIRIRGLPYALDRPPVDALAPRLPELLAGLGFDAGAAPPPARAGAGWLDALPESILGHDTLASPLARALRLQALATLTPRAEERLRERLFAASLVESEEADSTRAALRLVRARGLLHLGWRPAAMRALGAPHDAASATLAALFQGDLPAVETRLAAIESPLLRLMAAVEAGDMRARYQRFHAGEAQASAQALALPSQEWQTLVQWRMLAWDPWRVPGNAQVKLLLDRHFPIEGLSLETVLAAGQVIDGAADPDAHLDAAVVDHLARLYATRGARWCCTPAGEADGRLHDLAFLESAAVANIVRRIRRTGHAQALYEEALTQIERALTTFPQHPRLVLERAENHLALAGRASASARDGHQAQAHRDALQVVAWAQGQSLLSSRARGVIDRLRRPDLGTPDRAYAGEHPAHPRYASWHISYDPRTLAQEAMDALEVSWDSVQPARVWLSRVKTYRQAGAVLPQSGAVSLDAGEVLRHVEGRFRGNAAWTLEKAQVSLEHGAFADAQAMLRDGLALAPEHWATRYRLGVLLVRQGEHAQAARVLLEDPGFAEPQQRRVAQSNRAFFAGSIFWWQGDLDTARRFYDIAAGLRTGSGAGMTAAARLSLLDGDLMGAARANLEHVQRYGTAWAVRDYLSLLHLLGYAEHAWAAFDVVARRETHDGPWLSALVGHRLARSSDAELAEWAARDGLAQAGTGHYRFSARFLASHALHDREPSQELIDAVRRIDDVVLRNPTPGQDTLRIGPNRRFGVVVGPRSFAGSKRLVPKAYLERLVPMDSDLVSFLRAYRALLAGEHAQALATFDEQARHFDLLNGQLSYETPYHAYAAARAGQAEAFARRLEEVDAGARGFDWHLARAVLDLAGGDAERGLAGLRRAWNHFPELQDRPIVPGYQFLELCEWMYGLLADERLRTLALEVVESRKVIWPWFSWVHAFEARLTRDPDARHEALRRLLYLDPGSRRLAEADAAQVRAARESLGDANPFLPQAEAGTRL